MIHPIKTMEVFSKCHSRTVRCVNDEANSQPTDGSKDVTKIVAIRSVDVKIMARVITFPEVW